MAIIHPMYMLLQSVHVCNMIETTLRSYQKLLDAMEAYACSAIAPTLLSMRDMCSISSCSCRACSSTCTIFSRRLIAWHGHHRGPAAWVLSKEAFDRFDLSRIREKHSFTTLR